MEREQKKIAKIIYSLYIELDRLPIPEEICVEANIDCEIFEKKYFALCKTLKLSNYL